MFFRTFQEKSAVHGLCRGIKQNKDSFFKLQQDLMDIVYFFRSANSLTVNIVCIKNRLSR